MHTYGHTHSKTTFALIELRISHLCMEHQPWYIYKRWTFLDSMYTQGLRPSDWAFVVIYVFKYIIAWRSSILGHTLTTLLLQWKWIWRWLFRRLFKDPDDVPNQNAWQTLEGEWDKWNTRPNSQERAIDSPSHWTLGKWDHVVSCYPQLCPITSPETFTLRSHFI